MRRTVCNPPAPLWSRPLHPLKPNGVRVSIACARVAVAVCPCMVIPSGHVAVRVTLARAARELAAARTSHGQTDAPRCRTGALTHIMWHSGRLHQLWRGDRGEAALRRGAKAVVLRMRSVPLQRQRGVCSVWPRPAVALLEGLRATSQCMWAAGAPQRAPLATRPLALHGEWRPPVLVLSRSRSCDMFPARRGVASEYAYEACLHACGTWVGPDLACVWWGAPPLRGAGPPGRRSQKCCSCAPTQSGVDCVTQVSLILRAMLKRGQCC